MTTGILAEGVYVSLTGREQSLILPWVNWEPTWIFFKKKLEKISRSSSEVGKCKTHHDMKFTSIWCHRELQEWHQGQISGQKSRALAHRLSCSPHYHRVPNLFFFRHPKVPGTQDGDNPKWVLQEPNPTPPPCFAKQVLGSYTKHMKLSSSTSTHWSVKVSTTCTWIWGMAHRKDR